MDQYSPLLFVQYNNDIAEILISLRGLFSRKILPSSILVVVDHNDLKELNKYGNFPVKLKCDCINTPFINSQKHLGVQFSSNVKYFHILNALRILHIDSLGIIKKKTVFSLQQYLNMFVK